MAQDYFSWMMDCIYHDAYPYTSYTKLLALLDETPFYFLMSQDENRLEDGMSLRYRYCYAMKVDDDRLQRCSPCSVLEMMIALAIRCEEIMSDLRCGDRTALWFWAMIFNLGLILHNDSCFERELANKIISNFLSRNYTEYGNGGLFMISNPPEDVRNVEIWCQASWYFEEVMNREQNDYTP